MEEYGDSIFVLDRNYDIILVDEAGAQRFGLRPKEIIGRNYMKIVPDFEESGQAAMFEEVLRSGRTMEVENFVSNNIHGEMYLNLRIFRMGDGLGVISCDVTEKKKIREALEEHKEKYLALFEQNPVPTALTDLESEKFVDVNKAYLDFTGYSHEEILEKTPWQLGLCLEPSFRKEIGDQLWSLGSIKDFEGTLSIRTGEKRHILFGGRVVEIRGHNYLLSTTVEITRQKKMEEELKESEEKFASIFLKNTISMGLSSLIDGKYVLVNEAFSELSGYTREEAEGKTSAELGIFYDYSDRIRMKKELEAHGYLRDCQSVIQTKKDENGNVKRKIVLCSADLIELSGAKYLLATAIDITERRMAEKALEESERKFRSYIDYSPAGVLVVDREMRYVEVNEAACGMLGYSREELLSMAIQDLVVGGKPVLFGKLLEEGKALGEIWLKTKDGREICVLLSSVKISEDRFLAFCTEITDRKRMEEELRLFKMIADNSASGVAIARKDGRFVYSNKAWAGMHEPEYKTGGNNNMFNTYGHAGKDVIRIALERMESEESYFPNEEILHKREDGTEFPALVTFAGIKNQVGEIEYFVVYATDISDLKLALEETEVTERFLAQMSHDLRTPLNPIFGFLQLLQDTELTVFQRSCIDPMAFAVKTLLKLIDDILEFSRLRSGKMELEIRPFDIKGNLKDLCRMMEHKITEKNIAFELEIDPEIPDILQGDGFRLNRVFMNLISNATKFTPEKGDISVRLMLRDENIHFEVADSGIGFSSKESVSLFDAFFQVDSGEYRRYGGTGLGLAICRHLIELMGGKIEAFSNGEGLGAVFSVDFPFHTAPIGIETDDSRGKATDKVQRRRIVKSKMRILVAEDDMFNKRVISGFLDKLGYGDSFEIAVNGLEAVDACRANTYDLVLMDCQMPKLDGYGATREILELKGKATPVIIALTANAMPQDRERCIKAGMHDFMPKPLRIRGLEEKINEYFDVVDDESDEVMRDALNESELNLFRSVESAEDISRIFDCVTHLMNTYKDIPEVGTARDIMNCFPNVVKLLVNLELEHDNIISRDCCFARRPGVFFREFKDRISKFREDIRAVPGSREEILFLGSGMLVWAFYYGNEVMDMKILEMEDGLEGVRKELTVMIQDKWHVI